jgi:hypothetical protein
MARRSTRRGLFGTLYSPISHTLRAARSSVNAVANTSKGVVGVGLRGLNRIGHSVTNHANMAVGNVLGKRGLRLMSRRGNRKTRRGTRRNRRN